MAAACRVATVLLSLLLAGCAAPVRRLPIDPFPLRFPLSEVGSLEIEGRISGRPWVRDGIVYFATEDGSLTAVVVPFRSVLWRRPGGLWEADRRSSQEGQELILRVEGDHLQAFDAGMRRIWGFAADGRIVAEPAVSSGRVFFGTESRRFYCLKAATGKVLWSRRLQGAPLHPAVVHGKTLAVAASNSVVYVLSARGGSVLSWEAVPSRVIYPLAVAGPLVLVSSASSEVTAFDIKTRKRVGQYQADGTLVAGAVWSSPYVVLFVESPDSGRHRLVVLRSR